MRIDGMVHCFFEQSGTFKRAFAEYGIHAEDYDIQDNFGETDHVVDLFAEIEKAYDGNASLFDGVGEDDLIMAFFPCIYFSCVSAMWFSMTQRDYAQWDYKRIMDNIIERNQNRALFFERLNKLCGVALVRGLRLCFENPWNENHFLKFGFLKPPSIIDKDRMGRGDIRVKPTAYWFFNCEPTRGDTRQFDKQSQKRIHMKTAKGKAKGLCSEERSMISPDYARNFIADFILGRPAPNGRPQQADFFDDLSLPASGDAGPSPDGAGHAQHGADARADQSSLQIFPSGGGEFFPVG